MKKKPHILITNDDGVHAPGIKHLYTALNEMAMITVIAPATEQSAKSLSITIHEPLVIHTHDWGSPHRIYSITGTPADCVKMGMSVILDSKPDLVVSGINRGSNAGRNLLYSGTVAGAIESVLQGVPAIAFSCLDYWETDYKKAEEHVPAIVQHFLEHPIPKGTLLNVNFPNKESQGIRGYKMTRQGKEYWQESPEERSHPESKQVYYWLGAKLAQFEEHEDSDVVWLKKGYVTAAPIQVDELTDHALFASHRCTFDKLYQ